MLKQKGMTLIEIMIVVVILGILAAFAIPQYSQYVLRSHRVDATSMLLKIAAEQEKFYLQNNTYGTQAEIGAIISGAAAPKTQYGYFTVAITNTDATRDFSATATAIGQQLNDKDCLTFSIDQTGRGSSTKTGAVDSTASCWK